MIQVQAPDGTVVQFPAGTSHDIIKQVMRKNFGGPQPAQAAPSPSAPAEEGGFSYTDPSGAVTNDPAVARRWQAESKAQPGPQAQPATVGTSLAQGFTDPIHGGAQLLVNALPSGVTNAVNDATAWVNRQPVIGPVTRALGMTPATPEQINQGVAQRETDYQARRAASISPTLSGLITGKQQTPGMDWGRMGGQIAAGVVGARALPVGSSLLGSAAAGAASGGAMASLDPVTDPKADYWDEKKRQTEMGAVVGAAAGPAGFLLGRAIAPRIDPNVRSLRDAGVDMTTGQILGGTVRRVEGASTSIPLVGDQIMAAQRRSLESFNRATANRVLEPLGATVPDNIPVGRDMVGYVARQIGQTYDDAIAAARPFGPDQQFAAELQQLGQQFLTPDSQRIFINWVRNNVVSRINNGQLDGQAFQTIKSELGRVGRLYGGSANAAERELADAFTGLQSSLYGLLGRTNPQIEPALRAADRAYAMSVRMTDAAGRVGATEGVFTPQQLSSAVRNADRSVRHGAYARGDALLQELSDAGRAVLPNTIPDSGTTTRAMLNAGSLGALGVGTATGAVNPAVLAGAGAAYGAYTTPMQRALAEALLRRRPQAVETVGNQIAQSGAWSSLPLTTTLVAPQLFAPSP